MSIRIGQQLGSYEITATHSSGKAKAVHGTHFSTSLARMISLSLLSSGNFNTRQVATINRSAGSRWKDLGRTATSAAMAAEIGTIRTVRGWAAASNHSSKGMLKLILHFSSIVAVSHKLMSLSYGR